MSGSKSLKPENSNCLEGLRCPQCKQEDVLRIAGKALFNVVDGGANTYSDIEWDKDSFTRCPNCAHEGKLVEFYTSRQTENPPIRTYEVVVYETRRFVGRVKAAGRNEVNLLLQDFDGEDNRKHLEEDPEYYQNKIDSTQEVKS